MQAPPVVGRQPSSAPSRKPGLPFVGMPAVYDHNAE
jgi:hypothetical protein